MSPFAWWRWARRVLLLLLLVVLLVVGGTAVRVWQVARQDSHRASDAILVMGASQFDGRPSEVFLARLGHARRLWQDHVAPRIVTVGGGRPGDRFTEAAAGASWLAGHGVPKASLLAVGRGADTLDSLRAADRVFEQRAWRSTVIVTDPWHSLRAGRMARDLGFRAVTSPAHTGPAVRTRGTELRYIARETVAYLYYRLFHSDATRGPGAV